MRTAIYAVTITLSAALLFCVEPMVAKAFLPSFGGAAGVWIACVLFFQLTLLAGYAYAFALTHFLRGLAQRSLHVVLVLCALWTLPWATPVAQNAGSPTASILLSLAVSIGLPFFVLSATSPLLQTWYSNDDRARFPYRLFALSNAASLAALLAYPMLIEPAAALATQFHIWSRAFLAFAALLSTCAAIRVRHFPALKRTPSALPSTSTAIWWIALAACAAALWPAVANHLSQQVAPIPFLWVLPLALYLLSFILCFESDRWYRPRLFRILLPLACAAFALTLAAPSRIGGIAGEILTLLAALFICSMFCHGELAALKPAPEVGLAYFYLLVAFGGAIGAIFVAVIAPHVFDTYLELPIAVAACAILSLRLLYRIGRPRDILRLTLVAALAFVAATRFTGQSSVYRSRNFYGALQVLETGAGEDAVRRLFHGKVLHGAEFISPAKSRIPTAYYGPDSGGAQALSSIRKPNRRIAVIGLGAGALAAYGRPGDAFTFYDINPAVIEVAHTYFHFLDQSDAHIETVLADGRQAIARAPSASFDAIVLDAFSGDSIPVHLLTREAFRLYFDRLTPDGVLAVHVTNRYLDIGFVAEAAADDAHRLSRLVHSIAHPADEQLAADWVIIENTPAKTTPATFPKEIWTDEYSSIFTILR